MTDQPASTDDDYVSVAVAACRKALDSGTTKNLSDRRVAQIYAEVVMKSVKPPPTQAFVKRIGDAALTDGTAERIARLLQEQGCEVRRSFSVCPNPRTVRSAEPDPCQVNILE